VAGAGGDAGVSGHRSRGPWGVRGKRATARWIIQRYKIVDYPHAEAWTSRLKRYRAVHVVVDGRTVPIAWRIQAPAEVVSFHMHMLRFYSRFDSMAAPSMDERLTQAWEWTGAR
jgi:hypothetical protein